MWNKVKTHAASEDQSEWTFNVQNITPNDARRILEVSNRGNRKLRESAVQRYALMMKNDQWHLSPEAIVISNTGRLINGQHRLSAVVKSGETVPFLVIRGPEESVFSVLDRGVMRTTSDALQSDKKATEVAKLIVRLTASHVSHVTDYDVSVALSKIAETHHELISFCKTNATLFSSAPFRLAAIGRMMQGQDPEYIKHTYRNMVLANLDDLSSIGRAMIKMHLNNRKQFNSNGIFQLRLVGLAWNVFDPEKRYNVRVTYPQTMHWVEEVMDAVGYRKGETLEQNPVARRISIV